MKKEWGTLAKIGASAFLGYTGKTLEDMGGKQAISGRALTVASSLLLLWAGKDAFEMVNDKKDDDWDTVA